MTSAAAPPGRVGRDGALALVVERRGGRSVVAASRSTLPLQVLSPVALEDRAAVVSMLNPTGGVLGGDRLTVDVAIGPGAHACLTTPSATRVYRTAGLPAVQTLSARLAPGAVCEWVPDHTIPSPGAALIQALNFDVGEGATLIAIDAWAAGRVARGEAWTFARLESALTVRDAAGLVLHDRFVLHGDARWTGPGLAEGRPYFASVVVVTDRPLDAFLAGIPAAAAPAGPATRLGAAVLARRGAIVRCLADSAPALTATLAALWALARGTLLDAPPLALRKG